MAHNLPGGKTAARYFKHIFVAGFMLTALAAASFGQTCTAASSPAFVRVEGLAEIVGNINVTCTGVNSPSNALLYVTFNANVTNRLDTDGNLTGITLAGAGVTNGQPPTLNSATTISFSAVSVSSPSAAFTISGVRVAVPSVKNGGVNPLITAQLFATQMSFSNQAINVAVSGPTLLSSVFNYGLPCAGSPAPATVDIPTLLSTGTTASTVRVTEASAQAFQPISSAADSGVRLQLNLSGYPSSATVYVPDVIVGNGSASATSSGALGATASGGTYSPVTHSLLLVRVVGAKADGTGGTLLFNTPPATATTYTTAFQVPLVNGAATVTYEVVDASDIAIDTAQIPVWAAIPPFNCTLVPSATQGATLVPVSAAAVASQADPIPRYIASTPGTDCTVLKDCGASYFPQLQASPASLPLTGYSQGPKTTGYITLTDGGSNQYSFAVSVTYQTASGLSAGNWLSLNATTGVVGPTAGVGSFTLAVTADPSALLVQGTYNATITIDAGAAGKAIIPVTLTVGPTQPTIQAIVNAANGQPGPVTANSFATIYGINLVPKTTTYASVSVSGFPATVSYDGQPSANGPSQINFLVPAQLSNTTAVGVIVTVDGVNTSNFPVQLVPNAPAVFNPGILNQNNTVNLTSAPASRGDIVQVFLTGLTTPVSVPVSVKIGTETIGASQLFYAGPVASIPGLEQVNVQVPQGLSFTGNSVNLSVCIPGSGSEQSCSSPVPLYLQ